MMYELDSNELYKRRVCALIDKGMTLSDLSNSIKEDYHIVQKVMFGSRKSLRVELKIASYFSKEHDYLFETNIKRRKVS